MWCSNKHGHIQVNKLIYILICHTQTHTHTVLDFEYKHSNHNIYSVASPMRDNLETLQGKER